MESYLLSLLLKGHQLTLFWIIFISPSYYLLYFYLFNVCILNSVITMILSVFFSVATAAKLLQSCLTPGDPIDGSPPDSPVPGTLQARTLKWVAISFSNAWKWKVKVKPLCHVQLFATPWTAAHQVPLSMGFSRQEYWSGVPFPSPLATARHC